MTVAPAGRTAAWMTLAAALLFCAAVTVHAENWVRYSSQKMTFPAGDKGVSGNSQSFYDADTLRYYDRTRLEIWLKHVTYIGDLVPHVSRELLRIDCMTAAFESLVPVGDDPSVLTVINRGVLGSESAYRIISESYCGVPVTGR